MTSKTKCDELREALQQAKAALEPPSRDSALVSAAEPVQNIDPGDTAPDASPEVWQRIRSIEQAMHEAGCD